ncbi:RcpC/CpaB family pilus assembly protein, partial [Streptomyces sp. SID4982]|uniref:RcpC/CpaB family pilus assembly protein n=1 Tax=Streptomyces sp. SID4982 TaxID=2690291 RepID=UPI0013833F2D
RGHPTADPVRRHGPGELVRAPVRVADAAAVRLLRPGDRVDVVAAEERSAGGDAARVLARGARVARLPELPVPGAGPEAGAGEGSVTAGALVVLAVPRATAVRLVGASPTARLAVTLW